MVPKGNLNDRELSRVAASCSSAPNHCGHGVDFYLSLNLFLGFRLEYIDKESSSQLSRRLIATGTVIYSGGKQRRANHQVVVACIPCSKPSVSRRGQPTLPGDTVNMD